MEHYDISGSGLFLREDMPCPYIADGRMASLEFVIPSGGLDDAIDSFLAAGYRRSGFALYRNICHACRSCQPLRIETDVFEASRSQKRTLKENSDVRIEVCSPRVTEEKASLFEQYIISKHATGGENDCKDLKQTLSGLHYGYRGSIEMDYFLGDTLIGVGIADAGSASLSSVYFYYDTAHCNRRLGVFSILQEIAIARAADKNYYYLGFYLEETSKMSYKKSFRPNEVYRDGRWIRFTPSSSGG